MSQLVVDALLFDLDGTLVDSSASVERNWRRLAEKVDIPWERIGPWIHGIPVRQVLRMLEPEMPDEQLQEMHEFMVVAESTDTGDVVALPGAIAALDAVPTARWAIVTSGGVTLATARMAAAGLPTPRHLITADDVQMGKPAPDPYLAGARAVGYPPERCLAFEDAPAGITSAQAAGVPVIGIRSTHTELAVASVRSLAEIEFSVDRAGIVVTF